MKQSKHKLEDIENSVYANSVVIIVQNARVRQQADQVLIICNGIRQSYLISTVNNQNTTIFPQPEYEAFLRKKGKDGSKKGRELKEIKRLTQMLLLEPSTPTQHDSITSNQNHFLSLGCQLHGSKSCLCCYDFRYACRFCSGTSSEEFSNTCNGKPAVFEEL